MTTTRSTTTTTKAQRQRRWKILLCCSATLICAVAVVVLFWNNSGTQHNFLKGNKSYYRSSKSTTTLSSTSSTSNSAAKDLIKVFDQVLMISSTNNNKKKKSKQQHHHQDDIIHVGNLLEACEILAETIRDIGFSHSANDIMGNINKVRNLYDRFPSLLSSSSTENKELSIQVLIEYELDAGIHKDVTKSFDEQSASMGLLWLGRNINYQYDLFTHLLNDDDNMEPYEAAKKAYQDDLKPHLNWTLQQVGQAALLTLKPMKKITILNKISGRRRNMDDNDNEEEEDLETIQQDLKQVLSKWKPLLNKYKQTFHELNLGHKI